jgi:uncharacterized protein
MKYSKYNIFSRIRNYEDYFLVNLLTGSADIISGDEAKKVDLIRRGHSSGDKAFDNELIEKGYLIDEAEEAGLYRKKYLDFLDSRDDEEIQIFFVTNYSCNFACTYCYQDQYANSVKDLTSEVVDAFFNYIRDEFAGRRKYITIFGGEPLLNSPKQKELISYILSKSLESGLEVCFVTNGYYLEEYSGILASGIIREVQVTLDGTEDIHNNRRFLKGGGNTFEKIVKGIDSCLGNNININLRMVIDRDNINTLPDIALFASEKGWLKSPYFKTQLGRNYELHHCQSSRDKLFDRVSLYEAVYDLAKKHPGLMDFYRPAYSVAKFLFDNGKLPDPLFDACPACKTEWAFDYTGSIYSCTATVGKKDEVLGTFYPYITKKEELIEEWERRDITTISECRDCPVQLACGGGCGSLSKNRTGEICSADCRPVKELLELGFSAYFKNDIL